MSMGRKPCMVEASVMAVPALSCTGTTPSALSLMVRAALRMSSHDVGCHAAGSPALEKMLLL